MADFGKHDVHLDCGGTYSDEFDIFPPVIYTEPEYYPSSTYYYVLATNLHGAHGGTNVARIYDRDGIDITPATNPFSGKVGMQVTFRRHHV